ncbi:MAG: class I adenylate-forming enzyme family protein [Desertimonas sp.]
MNLDARPDLVSPIRSWARRDPTAPAISCGDETISRGELDRRSDALAAELARRGIAAGDRVGIIGGIGLGWCYSALGVLKLGATIVPMTERLSATEIAAMLGRVDATAVLVDAERQPIVEAATAAAPQRWKLVPFSELLDAPVPDAPFEHAARGDQLAVIAFTSGSTGLPKGSLMSHGAMMNAQFEYVLQEPHALRARALDVVSLAYLGGLLNSFLGPLIGGGSVVLLPKWDPRRALELIERERITAISGTTIFYEQMAEEPSFASADLSSLTLAIAGGNPVTRSLLEVWADKGVTLRQAYGLTEGCSLASLPSVELARSRPEVAGQGGILRRVRVVSDDGEDCQPGEPGQIVIEGPGIAAGYLDDPETTAVEFAGGRLHTGDVGTIDADGGLRVVGRTKDVIISGGINIYAAELERVIGELPGVVEVAVIGVADEQYGETPAALVVTSEPVDAVDVVDHCRSRLATYKTPRYVEFLDRQLPRSPLGKLAKDSLRVEFADLPERGRRLDGSSTRS